MSQEDNVDSGRWTSVDPNGGLIPFWRHPENHDMRLITKLEDENIVTSPFVLLSEEETLLAVKYSSVISGINVKTSESGEFSDDERRFRFHRTS